MPEESSMVKEPEGFKAQVYDKIAALITIAFGLVAALAWNNAIQAVFLRYFGPAEGALTSLIVYAIVVTIIAVLATIWIGRVAARAREPPTYGGMMPRAGSPGRPMG